MSPTELQYLVSKGESLTLEFKVKLPEPEKLAREAIALANTAGGHLLLGVDDNGDIPGIKDPDEASETFRQAIDKFCLPPLAYTWNEIPITPKRSVISIYIPASEQKPHRLVSTQSPEKPLTIIRIRDRSTTASPEMYHILRHRAQPRDVKVEYGEKEHRLMQYLEENGTVTVAEFASTAKIPKFVASRTLVHLVRANVLEVEPTETADLFRRK